MGRRGEAWVIGQAVILTLFIFAPRIGPTWPNAEVFHFVGWSLVVLAFPLLAWGALSLGRSLTPFPRPLPQGQLVTAGAYRFVRHPIYFSVLIGCVGLALASQSPLRLLLTLALLVFFDRKARREEIWLQDQYPEYASYKTRVKKLIPWIY
jgi:protein-S-isoprenylcysteine O-methyltransferase Ste14